MDQILPPTNPQDAEDTWANLANGSLPVSEVFRRMVEQGKAVTRNFSNDPVGTVMPLSRPMAALVKEIPAYVSDLGRRNTDVPANSYFSEPNPRVDLPAPPQVGPGRRYVDETDKVMHATVPGYVPRRDRTWEPPSAPGH
jgi:hypothetical protein